MRISDWSSDVCSSDLLAGDHGIGRDVGDAHRRLGLVDMLAAGTGQQADGGFRQDDQRLRVVGGDAAVAGEADLVAAAERRAVDRGDEGLAGLLDVAEQFLQGKRSEEHTSELQSLMRISYAVFCLKKKNSKITHITRETLVKMST